MTKIMLLVCIVFTSAFAVNDLYIVPVRERVGIFERSVRKLYDKPVFEAGVSDVLRVVKTADHHYLVENSLGKRGWVEKTLCARALQGTRFQFDPKQIDGLGEDMNTAQVWGNTDPEDVSLELTRSFSEELRVNIDKESITTLHSCAGDE